MSNEREEERQMTRLEEIAAEAGVSAEWLRQYLRLEIVKRADERGLLNSYLARFEEVWAL